MQLGLAVAGAALGAWMAPVGFAFLGMSGAQLGWAGGSMLGSLLSGGDDVQLPGQFGPRLADLKVQTSTYGNAIPRAFGTVRIAGNIIWSPPIREVATTQTIETGGGKGGGAPSSSQEQTTYAYFADFAVAICEGPIIGIRKMWANGDLIVDQGDDSTVLSGLTGFMTVLNGQTLPSVGNGLQNAMTVYLGTETQVADPTMAAETGNLTPAYRGTAYVVFNDLALERYGNRVPNFEFEVVVNGSRAEMSLKLFYTLPSGSLYARGGDATESRRNSPGATHYWAVLENGSPLQPRHIGLFDNYTHAQILSRVETGNVWLASENGLNGRVWYDVEGDQIKAISPSGQVWEWGNLLASYDFIVQIYEFAVTDDPDLADQENFPEIFLQKVNVGPGSISIMHGNAGAMLELATVSTGHGVNQFFDSADRIAGRVYVFCSTFGGTPNSHIGYASTGAGNTFTVVRTYDSAADCPGMVGRDGYLYVKSANTGFFNVIEKLNADGGVVDSITLPGILTTNTDEVRMVQDVAGMLYIQLDQEVFRVNSGTMELDAQTSLPNETWIMPTDAFEGRGVLVVRDDIGHRDKLYVLADVVASAAPLLSEVVEDLCLLTGLTGGDLDTTDLVNDTVSGYVIARRGTVRSMIEPLMATYFFDAVESDNKIKFVMRGGAVAVTIPEDDLGAHTGAPGEMPDPLRVMRKQELELPVQVDIAYLRRESDYQVSVQQSRRLITQSKQAITLQAPIVFTDDEARHIADTHMFSAWVERESHEFEVGRKYLKYEPTDVIGVVKGGVTHNVRIVQKDEGGDGVIKMRAVADYATVYAQATTGVAPQAEPQSVSTVGPTTIEFLDVPLLLDAHDDAGFIFAAYGSAAGWRGVNLYQSIDGGVNYSAVGSLLPESTIGHAVDALGDYDESLVEFIDEGNAVTVFIAAGSSLASITRAELLEGSANWAVMGGELIQFRDATLIGTDTYTLTGLLRGRRGSESYMATHVAGERFVLLNDNLRTVSQPVSLANQSLFYKAVSIGRTLAQTNPVAFLNTARRKKPLAPIHLGGGKNAAGDWVFEWTRRTRYVAPFVPGFNVPLGEATERYLAEMIVDSAVVYSVEVTEPTATYPAADQTLEFGGQIGAVTLRVSQISDEVGAGQSAERAFTDFRYHRYWRLTTLNITDATFEIAEIQFLSGGVNITSQGTYSSSVAPNVVTTLGELFDGSLITRTIWTAAQAEDPSFWIKIDFGVTPKTVDGIKQAGYDTTGRHMTGFTLEWSDDNSLWTVLGSKAGLTYPGNNTLSALYTLP